MFRLDLLWDNYADLLFRNRLRGNLRHAKCKIPRVADFQGINNNLQ